MPEKNSADERPSKPQKAKVKSTKGAKKENEALQTSKLRKQAVASTRKRFIQLISTSAGASLAACGYGFVPSNESRAENPLYIAMDDRYRRLLTFFMELPRRRTLQDQFIVDPVGTMKANEVTSLSTKAEISAANRLTFYLLSNKRLANDLTAIAKQSQGLQALQQNDFTENNPNISSYRAVTKEIFSHPDVRKVIEEQTYVLLSNHTVRSILNIELEPDEIQGYSKRLTTQLPDSKIEPLFPVPNVFVWLNIIFVVNIIVSFNIYYNVSISVSTTTCGNGPFMGICGQSRSDYRVWSAFFSRLVERADAMKMSS